MQTTTRTLFVPQAWRLSQSLAVGAAASGPTAGPTAPSAVAGATIAGTVNRAVAGAPVGLTVTVVGTSLSAVVETAGEFQIAGVPSGNVQLLFKDATVNAMAQLANVGRRSSFRSR